MSYTIKQVSGLTGLPASTLRYYESEELLFPVRRNESGRRVYDEKALDTLSIITCLKKTGMPIQQIRSFIALCSAGDKTLGERYEMILAHKRSVENRIAELQHEMEHINYKVAYYCAACRAGTERELKGLKYPDSRNCGFEYTAKRSAESAAGKCAP
jgi:Predicted transcriptional regulators